MRSSKPASTSGTNPDMIYDQNMLNPLSQLCNSIESCYVIDPLTGKATSSQPLSQSMASNDSNYLVPPKVKSRKFVLCVTQGCGGRFVCQKLRLYGGLPLKGKNKNFRQQLSSNLIKKSSFRIFFRNKGDERSIMKSFPRGTLPAVILHRRYMIDKHMIEPDQSDNYCIECKILLIGGKEDPRYTLVLFRVGDVAAYVTKNQLNVVLSLLQGSTVI